MKNVLKKIIVFTFVAGVLHFMALSDTYAASSVSISGGDNVNGGEVFTITVTFDGEDIGRVVGDITYDTELLSYISGGSSSGNVGYVELKNAGTGEPLTFNLKFQALKEGSTEVTVSASEMYDLGEGYMDTPSAQKTVMISGNADEKEIIEETTEPDDTAAEDNLSVDEKDDMTEVSSGINTETNESAENADKSGSMAKYIMYGIGGLVVFLLIVMILRRKR